MAAASMACKVGPTGSCRGCVDCSVQRPELVVMGGASREEEEADLAELLVGEELTCEICSVKFTITADDSKKYRLQDHCLSCSSKARNVTYKQPDPAVKAWFKGLRKVDLPQYRQILEECDKTKGKDSAGSARRGLGQPSTTAKFNLASYKERHEQTRGQKQKYGMELLSFPWYKAGVSGFWVPDLFGDRV